jgi:imidazolonepropionase-like amidohydrolase
MTIRLRALLLACAVTLLPWAASAQANAPAAPAAPAETVFRDVRVFDGKSGRLSGPTDVLVRGQRIAAVGNVTPAPGATTIQGGGRTLMPGLIDAHWHVLLVRPTPEQAIYGDIGYTNILGALEATATLMRGFTSVRDLGGPAFALKRAIDEGLVAGPRVWPSGAMISITGGHGDFRQLTDLPRDASAPLSRMEAIGGSLIADSPDAVRQRVREQLMQGASQIKLTAGGGVASPHSPIDIATFTGDELRAAVEAAANWGTYVTVHAYTPQAIRLAVEAGVKSIEHAHLMDEATAKLLAERGVWLSTQPFLDDEDATPFPPGSVQALKQRIVIAGTDRAYTLARAHGVKLAFGTDILFSERIARRQGAQLTKLVRWFPPGEVLRMATGTNGELLALSGPRNPYPGPIGVIEPGALADLLLVDGDPLVDIKLLEDPERRLLVIMKDGKVYKNTLAR